MISAVLIVKNEEKLLSRCLDSIKWKVDEIIIVDTWSSDKTKKIAKKYTSKILDFTWCDDFAKARNFAKSKASWDWILSIDADEQYEWLPPKLWIEQNDADAFIVQLKEENGSNKSTAIRLFKKELEWNWKIHEHITCNPTRVMESDIVIRFGRSPTHDEDPMRNLRILSNEYKSWKRDARTCYYLGKELLNFEQYELSKDAFVEYIWKSNYIPEKADAFLMIACAESAIWNKSNAISFAVNAIALCPDLKVAYELIAEISWENLWSKHAEIANNEKCLASYDYKFIRELARL